jgi:hypothetical protein
VIVVLEGPDGTGKSTLAKAIEAQLEGTIFHSGVRVRGDVENYHGALMSTAIDLGKNANIDVVFDRWAPSEEVYGSVYRDGPEYETQALCEWAADHADVRWVYCRNDRAAENHQRNRERRPEYVNDLGPIIDGYEAYVAETRVLGWQTYDFTKVEMDDFVRLITRTDEPPVLCLEDDPSGFWCCSREKGHEPPHQAHEMHDLSSPAVQTW